ncbi:autoinducer binding domain-containing protein [Limimaricola hongkongensis]|uniref:DNA-binding HTH domain-containing protein n=1 Tax=Limimaricola hongkongensis DSM 17492 TaxID=1122180 RepID=A0A017H7M0_9RHOB|nr:autoinducer binding domain-containing protein [Limimaricola hongkongensis]EYD70376.1 DNA-binding HTH domain-containing protein [Limimaricola hongkongensis DSM 17492]
MHSYAPHDFSELARLAPAGFSAVLRVRRGRAAHIENCYAQSWRDTYARKSYFLRDPAIGWALSHDGVACWDSLAARDPNGVIADAQAHGLCHGITAATGDAETRSFCGLARADRPFTAAERDLALAIIARLHAGAPGAIELTAAQREALRLMASGERHARAAGIIGISASALKARLKSARAALGARTTAEAVHAAQMRGMI